MVVCTFFPCQIYGDDVSTIGIITTTMEPDPLLPALASDVGRENNVFGTWTRLAPERAERHPCRARQPSPRPMASSSETIARCNGGNEPRAYSVKARRVWRPPLPTTKIRSAARKTPNSHRLLLQLWMSDDCGITSLRW